MDQEPREGWRSLLFDILVTTILAGIVLAAILGAGLFFFYE